MIISVIIPTKNRSLILKMCLQSIISQLGKKDELIVVDNGSTDDTKNIVFLKQKGFPIRYFFEPRKGPSYARNLGIKHAKGEILAFLDDDCLVSPHWLSSIKRVCNEEINKGERNVYQGKINHKFNGNYLLSEIFFAKDNEAWQRIVKKPGWRERKYINFLQAGNFFLRKEILNSLEYVFDAKTFPFIGEERDLSARLQLAGYNIIYTPQVLVTHLKQKPKLLKSFKVAFYYGRAEGILVKRYITSKTTKDLFEYEPIRDKSLTLAKIRAIRKPFRQKGLIPYFTVSVYLLVRELVYNLGKIYGKIAKDT